MELIPLGAGNREAWDGFCAASPDAWFWHTTDWLDYSLSYRPELRARPLSFLCVEGPRVLAAAPLMLTHHETPGRSWKAFSLGGGYLPSPALAAGLEEPEREDALAFVFDAVDDLAEELGVAHSMFRTEVLRPSFRQARVPPFNVPLRHGYIDCSVNTQLIDLRLSRNELRAGLRRNHQRSIERARELFRIAVYSGAELSDAVFESYVGMHARAAGRTTRPRATFDMMRSWIRSGRGMAVEARTKEGRPAGFELYILYKGAAYGLSACNEPEYKHLPIRHLIEWEAMMRMRERGVEFYDIGGQHFGILPYSFPEKKNMDISLFKRGFGGATLPFFHAERFHDPAHWESESAERARRFAARYPFKPSERGAQGRALLARLERGEAAGPERAPAGAEAVPIPEALLRAAEAVVREHARTAREAAAGNVRALHFLVGRALRGAGGGRDPLQMRRAVESSLARAVDSGPET